MVARALATNTARSVVENSRCSQQLGQLLRWPAFTSSILRMVTAIPHALTERLLGEIEHLAVRLELRAE